ncbi:MAG: response regulator [Pseudomonadota bacterium]
MAKIKVLMVDDEVQFRETTSKILTRRGYETTMAGTGEEAINILKKTPHDVVVLDIKMPGMGGEEALAAIKKIDAKTQVIMLTGHGGLESARKSLGRDAFDYLSKPCDLDRLTARINDAYSIGRQDMKGEKKAADIMIPLADYTTIGPDASVKEGIMALNRSFGELASTSRLMQAGHRSIMVLDKKGELVGILTIMDLVEALRPAYLSAPKPSTADNLHFSAMFWSGLFTAQAKALAGKKISDVMSDPPPTVDINANLMETANLMFETEARRLAVVGSGKVVGVVREQEIFFELARIILQG